MPGNGLRNMAGKVADIPVVFFNRIPPDRRRLIECRIQGIDLKFTTVFRAKEQHAIYHLTSTTNGWSWQPERTDYRTPQQLRDTFAACRQMGASMFQNPGPMGDGRLNPVEVT
jgi:hypothetical protein